MELYCNFKKKILDKQEDCKKLNALLQSDSMATVQMSKSEQQPAKELKIKTKKSSKSSKNENRIKIVPNQRKFLIGF